jgi:hypothetical protein
MKLFVVARVKRRRRQTRRRRNYTREGKRERKRERTKYEYFSTIPRAYLYRNLSEEMPIQFEKRTPLIKNNGSFSRAAVQGKKFKKSKATETTQINSYQTH